MMLLWSWHGLIFWGLFDLIEYLAKIWYVLICFMQFIICHRIRNHTAFINDLFVVFISISYWDIFTPSKGLYVFLLEGSNSFLTSSDTGHYILFYVKFERLHSHRFCVFAFFNNKTVLTSLVLNAPNVLCSTISKTNVVPFQNKM